MKSIHLTLLMVLSLSCNKEKKHNDTDESTNPPTLDREEIYLVAEKCIDEHLDKKLDKTSSIIDISKAFTIIGKNCNLTLNQIEKYFDGVTK